MSERFIIAYYIIACLYSAWRLLRRSGDYATGILLALLLPFGGVPLAFLAETLRKRSTPVQGTDRFEQLMEKEGDMRERIYRQVDIGKETNIVPMEEALVVNDHLTRRRLLLDMLKNEADGHVQLLEQAVNNEDTETSHYAVSAVMEMKRKLQTNLQRLTVEYEQRPGVPEVAAEYAGALQRLIASGFMDTRMKNGYLITYSHVLGQLIADGYHDESVMKSKIDCELKLRRYEAAARDCAMFRELYPGSEQAFLSSLELCYTLKQRESFFHLLDQLKASRIRVSNGTLNIIRYWSNKDATG